MPKVISVLPNSVCKEIGVDYNAILNSAKEEKSMYMKFQEELVVDGTIKWCLHNEMTDICVMSDINSSTGALLLLSFVHVTCMKMEDDNIIFRCTCHIYRIIQCAAYQQVPIWPEDAETFPDNSFTCMHCQFYKDFLVNAYERLIQQNTCLTQALNKVQESLQYMNYPVHLLGNVLTHATTKFSVQGDSTYSVVTFSFHQGKCFAKCTDGICCAQMLNRKKILKKITIEHSDKICPHLNTIYQNFDYVKGFFQVYFGSQEDSLENVEQEDTLSVNLASEDINTEDANLQIESSTNSDEETSMWDFKALSRHTPHRNMLDVNLVRNTQNRNDIVISTNFDPNYGVYVTYGVFMVAFLHARACQRARVRLLMRDIGRHAQLLTSSRRNVVIWCCKKR